MKKSLLMLVAVLAFIGADLPSVMAADGSESIVVRVKFRILDLKKDWVAKMPVTVGAIRLKWLDKIPIGTQALIKRITAEVVNIVSYESKPSEVVSQFVMRNAKQIDFTVRPVTYNRNRWSGLLDNHSLLSYYHDEENRVFKGRVKITITGNKITDVELIDVFDMGRTRFEFEPKWAGTPTYEDVTPTNGVGPYTNGINQ